MAKRTFLEEGEKKQINSTTLRKLIGIFRYALPYRWTFVLGLVSLGFSSLTMLSFPFLAGKILDIAQGKGNFFLTTIPQIGIAILSVLILQSIFSFTRVYTFAIVSEKTLADVRAAVYEKLIWLPQTFFDKRRVGELISRVTSDVGTLQDTFTYTLAEFLRQILILVVGIPVIAILTPRLTIFMLLTFPVLVIMALFFGKFIRGMSKRTQDLLAGSNIVVEETLHSIPVVKSFTNELFEVARYRRSLTEMVRVAIRSSKYRGLFIAFSIFTLFGGIVAVGWYGALLVQENIITVGELFSFVLYTTFIGASIAGLGDVYTQLQRSIGASERLLEIMDEKDEHEPAKGNLRLTGAIEFDNVGFSYPTRADVKVLKDISFSIRPGEKVALVGPSGSGKSTVINLLLRFYRADSGSIRIDGNEIAHYPLSDFRSNIGIVPQEVILFGGTIRDNILYGRPGATNEEIEKAAERANALEYINSFPDKFNTLVGDRGVKLSGGQRQRVAIARAILKDPAILVLDEATSSLDVKSEKEVQLALEQLMENRTTIVIAHRLSTIRKVDRILVVRDGRIQESGSHQELSQMENGVYNNLLRLQLESNQA